MSQSDLSTYGFKLDVAQPGQWADISPRNDTMSYAAEEEIPFGKAVVQGDEDDTTKVASDAGDDFIGIAIFTQGIENPLHNGTLGGSTAYKAKDTVSVGVKGRVQVLVTDDVTAGAAAYVDVVSTETGDFTDVSTNNLGPVGKFRNSAEAGQVAIIDLNF